MQEIELPILSKLILYKYYFKIFYLKLIYFVFLDLNIIYNKIQFIKFL